MRRQPVLCHDVSGRKASWAALLEFTQVWRDSTGEPGVALDKPLNKSTIALAKVEGNEFAFSWLLTCVTANISYLARHPGVIRRRLFQLRWLTVSAVSKRLQAQFRTRYFGGRNWKSGTSHRLDGCKRIYLNHLRHFFRQSICYRRLLYLR